MIKISTRGSFTNLDEFLRRMRARSYLKRLEKYGIQGVAALQAATPEDSGETAHGWTYEIAQHQGYFSIHWLNSHTQEPGHIPVAVLIQYGHATGNGGYVHGIDFINPALRPIFEQIATEAWREVIK